MKKSLLLLGIGVAIGAAMVVGFIYYRSNRIIEVPPRPEPPISQPPAVSGKCGLEGCHGLDVTCGQNIAEMCDAMYRAGDNCRQYVQCGLVSGQCRLLPSPKFDSCKSCVQDCEATYSKQPDKVMECESRCVSL